MRDRGMRNKYRTLFGNLKVRGNFGDMNPERKIILKWL
jgi:hypothetical protein